MLVMLINTVVMQTNGVVDSIRTLERNISGNALVDQLVQVIHIHTYEEGHTFGHVLKCRVIDLSYRVINLSCRA